ncbi:sulfatase [Halalkaliarchaeum sp. AArc-GB]|uniref:sulfatase n=1 Tax=Halalkaliarchaeum sp. AArc-GB TaxID=3074078 RepID=UPI0028574496|nr:sulfatase [Halalkaliarchaeum sp. AArc-GB]MDR5674638.1 sulfatase [Halalkaliarchaeum sp. AArc-GB]
MTDHDVLFLVLDSVRHDRVSFHGHDRETTPSLDAFAQEATVFENAYVPAPWTLPSHSSMFTGLFPTEHGVTNGFADGTARLPAEVTPLAERLSKRGYRTAGFSNNPWVGSVAGLDRGFDEFVEWDLRIGSDGGTDIHRTRDRIYSRVHTGLGYAAKQPAFLIKRRFFTANLVDRAVRWLERTADDDQPTFTFLNLMEAHSPYFPPRSAFRQLDLDPPGPIEPRLLNTKLLAYVLGKADLPPERRRRVLEYYDASVRYQDRKVDELLTALRETGRFDDTLVVVCSDHGKTLGEYDRDGTPPHYVRDVNTDVPLVVKTPDQEVGQRIEEPAELVGIHDLILEGSSPRDWLCSNEYALVEDFVPHTGRNKTDVSRWRTLCGPNSRYVYDDEENREYFFGEFDDGENEHQRESMRLAFEERVRGLSRATGRESTGDLDAAVEAQLTDLGYMK